MENCKVCLINVGRVIVKREFMLVYGFWTKFMNSIRTMKKIIKNQCYVSREMILDFDSIIIEDY
jgi:hypothetical protein